MSDENADIGAQRRTDKGKARQTGTMMMMDDDEVGSFMQAEKAAAAAVAAAVERELDAQESLDRAPAGEYTGPVFTHGLATHVGGLAMSAARPKGGHSSKKRTARRRDRSQDAAASQLPSTSHEAISARAAEKRRDTEEAYSQLDDVHASSSSYSGDSDDSSGWTGDEMDEDHREAEQEEAQVAAAARQINSLLRARLAKARRRADRELYRVFEESAQARIKSPAALLRERLQPDGTPSVSPGWHVPETGMQDSLPAAAAILHAEQQTAIQRARRRSSNNTVASLSSREDAAEQQQVANGVDGTSAAPAGEGAEAVVAPPGNGGMIPLRVALEDEPSYVPLRSFPGGRIPEALKNKLRQRLGLRSLDAILQEVAGEFESE